MQFALQAPSVPFITLRANIGVIAAAYIPWGKQPTLVINDHLSPEQASVIIERVSLAQPRCAGIINIEGEEQCASS
jgi:hypothetical protein